MKALKVLLAGVTALTVVAAQAGSAHSAPKPLIGPPPAWVDPPAPPSAEAADISRLPVTMLLNDAQFSFDTDGWTEYRALRAKVQGATGLQALSAIPFQWSPWSDTITFHSAHILRGDQTINILPKDGECTILRRETGLEQGLLNGALTALLQPDGLQIGDVLEVAVSIRHADPLLKGRVGILISNWDLAPVARMRLKVRWPSSVPMRWRETAGLPQLRKTDANGISRASLDLEDVRPLILPALAPARFQHGRQIELTILPDWRAVAQVMAPLYAKAAEISAQSPLAAQAKQIVDKTTDLKGRAGAALQLVQEQVRYLAHVEDAGGYTPQSAEDTWRLRYGDCKAKTVLLLALLHQLGVPAEPVLASVAEGDGLNEHLPSPLLFDHALVRVRLKGKDYWLDGTRQGDRGLDDLSTPAYGWVLPLNSAEGGLVHVIPPPPTKPQMTQVIRYDASGGMTAPEPSKFKTTFRGDAAVLIHSKLSELPPGQFEAGLRAYWASVHNAFTPAHVAAAWDAETGEETLTADGVSKLDWTNAGLELQHVEFGGAPNVKRDPASVFPEAPYVVSFPSYVETDESVQLPAGSTLPAHPVGAADVDTTIAGVAYRRTSSIEGNVVRVVAIQRSLQPEITAVEARASVDPLTKLGDQGVYVSADLLPKSVTDAAAIESRPTTVDDHLKRGNALLDAGRSKEALDEFDATTTVDPKSQMGWADRSIAHAWQGDRAATAEADKADSLGAPTIVSARARALLAEKTDDLDGARAGFQHALSILPDDPFSLERLIDIELRSSNTDAARKDFDKLLHSHPDLASQLHFIRAAIEAAAHEKAAAERELALVPALTAEAHLSRAQAYRRLGDTTLALADLDESIKLKPTTEALLLKASFEGGYGAAADADVQAALRLEPGNLEAQLWRVNQANAREDYPTALTMMNRIIPQHEDASGNLLVGRAQIENKLGLKAQTDADFTRAEAASGKAAADGEVLCNGEMQAKWRPEAAIADCARALRANPKSPRLLIYQVLLLSRTGRSANAKTALADAEAAIHDAYGLNSLCYSLAVENIELDRALAACDSALKLEPKNAAILDSRAFTLLRLGRNVEALNAYNVALRENSKEYNSLYGRAVIEARLNLKVESDRDKKQALAVRPRLKGTFSEMGVAE